MRTLLTVINDSTATSVLETALLAARRFDGRIVGVNALASEHFTVYGGNSAFAMSADVFHALESADAQSRSDARMLFEQFMQSHNVPITGEEAAPERGVSAEWREESGRSQDLVGSIGRVFDLIVVERPHPTKRGFANLATLENALFESGRPVLMAPPEAGATIGQKIIVAWNGSTETARTVALSMPYLVLADSVEVLSVEGAMQPGPSGDDLASNLRRRGLGATSRHLPASDRSAGEVILAEAKAAGCDLLIKGAYTQSRLRQMIFGGTTRHIIMSAGIPVILAH